MSIDFRFYELMDFFTVRQAAYLWNNEEIPHLGEEDDSLIPANVAITLKIFRASIDGWINELVVLENDPCFDPEDKQQFINDAKMPGTAGTSYNGLFYKLAVEIFYFFEPDTHESNINRAINTFSFSRYEWKEFAKLKNQKPAFLFPEERGSAASGESKTGNPEIETYINQLKHENIIMKGKLEAYEGSTFQGSVLRNLRKDQIHRERTRAIALLLWKNEPDLPIAQLADREEIINIACERKLYGENTIREWVKDLSPNHGKPGRPKKK